MVADTLFKIESYCLLAAHTLADQVGAIHSLGKIAKSYKNGKCQLITIEQTQPTLYAQLLALITADLSQLAMLDDTHGSLKHGDAVSMCDATTGSGSAAAKIAIA